MESAGDHDTVLEEAAERDHIDMSAAAKTPVSLLQELYVKKGINPKYDLIQIEGAIHEPTFKYRVSVGDLVAVGSGQSKKKAKHAAAKAVLDKMCGFNGHQRFNMFLEEFDDGGGRQQLVTSPYDDGIPGNPVGRLQELCISHRWAPPTYLLDGENGLPHEREFVITCLVEQCKEVGAGKSKKLAKRQAAHRMLGKLKDTPLEATPTGAAAAAAATAAAGFDDEDEIAQRAALKSSNLKDSQSAKSQGLKITQFHRSLKKLTGEKTAALQGLCLDDAEVDCALLLEEISLEHKFDATYVDIEENTHSGGFQCLLTMSLTPIAVSYGSGPSYEMARKQAAFNGLQYLKVMTRK